MREDPWTEGAGQARPTSGAARDGIFISYRHDDSLPEVGRLTADLRGYFGERRIYRDLESNRPAQDFVRQMEEALDHSCAVIAVIGGQWLDAVDDAGVRRLDAPGDFVRSELEVALAEDLVLVPVLVGDAKAPRADELPPSLRKLAHKQCVHLSDRHWNHDVNLVVETLESHGVLPSYDTRPSDRAGITQGLTTTQRYRRTIHASRRGAYTALAGAVRQLRYPVVEVDEEAAKVVFVVFGRRVTAVVLDTDRAGWSTVAISFASVKAGALAAGVGALALVTTPLALAGWPLLRRWERRFTAGFLDNVQRVFGGERVTQDSSLPPGVQRWRDHRREV